MIGSVKKQRVTHVWDYDKNFNMSWPICQPGYTPTFNIYTGKCDTVIKDSGKPMCKNCLRMIKFYTDALEKINARETNSTPDLADSSKETKC